MRCLIQADRHSFIDILQLFCKSGGYCMVVCNNEPLDMTFLRNIYFRTLPILVYVNGDHLNILLISFFQRWFNKSRMLTENEKLWEKCQVMVNFRSCDLDRHFPKLCFIKKFFLRSRKFCFAIIIDLENSSAGKNKNRFLVYLSQNSFLFTTITVKLTYE